MHRNIVGWVEQILSPVAYGWRDAPVTNLIYKRFPLSKQFAECVHHSGVGDIKV